MTEDLEIYFTQFGVPVSYAGAPAGAQGIVDVADATVAATDLFPGVIGTMRVVAIIATAAALALRMGDPITVDGAAYTVAHHARVDDGALMRVYLQDG